MPVKLEASIRRWIGLSTDTKPFVGTQADGLVVAATDLPPGSSFLETDTGRIYRYDGDNWTVVIPEDVAAQRHSEVLVMLAAIRETIIEGLA